MNMKGYQHNMVNIVTNASAGIVARGRSLNTIGFAFCSFMLAYAWYLQNHEGLIPCPLCLAQRFDIAILGLVFLVAALHNRYRRFYSVMILFLAVIGIMMASYQLWLQNQPATTPNTCLPPLNILLNAFPLTEAIGIILKSPGDCSKADWTLMGLSIPAWTLIGFTGLGTLGSTSNWETATKKC